MPDQVRHDEGGRPPPPSPQKLHSSHFVAFKGIDRDHPPPAGLDFDQADEKVEREQQNDVLRPSARANARTVRTRAEDLSISAC